MKNIIQSITINSSHSITVNDTYFQTLTKAQILSIYDRTTGTIIVADTDVESKITITNGNTITTDASLPAFVADHTILMTVDAGMVGVDGVVADQNSYRSKIAAATTLKGQAATASDTGDQIAEKIKAISTSITVNPIQGNPSYYHDLASEVANFADVENPYAIAILLREGFKNVYLSGASKYKTSDGVIQTGSPGLYTIGANSDNTKRTNYIIYRFPTISADMRFGSNFSTINYALDMLQAYLYGVSYNSISFIGCKLSRLFLDSSTEVPYVINSVRTPLAIPTYAFSGTRLMRYTFPAFRSDALNSEKVVNIPQYCFQNSTIEEIGLPTGLLALNIDTYAFSGSGLTSLTIPANCYCTLTSGGNQFTSSNLRLIKFDSGSSLYANGNSSTMPQIGIPTGCDIYFGSSMSTLSITTYGTIGLTLGNMYIGIPTSAPIFACTGTSICVTINSVELESGWNWTLAFNKFPLPVEGTASFKTKFIDKLVDYRADGVTTPTISANGTSTITIVNGNCTKVHRSGDTIYVNAVAKVIQSVIDDTHLQLTTTVASASGLSYGTGKTITLLAALKTSMTTDYPNWATEVAAKGWTIA